MNRRLRGALLWLLAVAMTAALAVFQRMTGPTHPARGSVQLADSDELQFRLPRSHGGDGGLMVRLQLPRGELSADLVWRRFPTDEAWQRIPFRPFSDGEVVAVLPHQPPAGKVEYRIEVIDSGELLTLPGGEAVVARFRGAVPVAVLVPHILAIFGSMLLATRALLEVLRPRQRSPRLAIMLSMLLLIVGGLILGPIVQKFAFGALWTGWPLGTDLTDNKTAIAFLAWLPATILAARRRRTRLAVVAGWIVMMGVFLIPHSLRGSEIDWAVQGSAAAPRTAAES